MFNCFNKKLEKDYLWAVPLYEAPGWEWARQKNKQHCTHLVWHNLHKHSHQQAKKPLCINNTGRLANPSQTPSLHNTVTYQFSLKAMSQQKLDMNHSPALNSSLQPWHSGFLCSLYCSVLRQETKLYKELLVLSTASGSLLLEPRV